MDSQVDIPQVDAVIIDGAVAVQMLPPGMAGTFQEYADTIFIPYILRLLEKGKRVDVVWNVYRPDSFKLTTRQNRGRGQLMQRNCGLLSELGSILDILQLIKLLPNWVHTKAKLFQCFMQVLAAIQSRSLLEEGR